MILLRVVGVVGIVMSAVCFGMTLQLLTQGGDRWWLALALAVFNLVGGVKILRSSRRTV